MKKVLFVCLGNICRSPAAEGVMKSIISKENLNDRIFVDSAGTGAWHAGELPDARMREHAKKRGVILDSHARQFDASRDFEKFDYIVVMDDENYQDILAKDLKQIYSNKIFKMTNFKQKTSDNNVPDPYYGGAGGFEKVLDIVEDCSLGLLKHIKKEI